jgi:CHAT domain-containing protein
MGGVMAFSWSPLAFTSTESGAVVALHDEAFPRGSTLLLSGSDPTEERLKAELPRHGVAHLATHGFFAPEGLPSMFDSALEGTGESDARPGTAGRLDGYAPGLLSGIVCAGANAPPSPGRDDGYLTAEEVGWLDLSRVDLVVLSACETGLGRPQSGEGLLGLRRALLGAGARTVISSLWNVPDENTSRLMEDFYRNLWERHLPRGEALRTAQLALLERNRAESGVALPATWGAFVLEGEWR